MSNGNGGNSSVKIVAIVAVLILVGGAIWFVWGRPGGARAPATTTNTTSEKADSDINVKIDLPDSVTIK